MTIIEASRLELPQLTKGEKRDQIRSLSAIAGTRQCFKTDEYCNLVAFPGWDT